MEFAGSAVQQKRLPKFKGGKAAFTSAPQPTHIRINYLSQKTSIRKFLQSWRPHMSAKEAALASDSVDQSAEQASDPLHGLYMEQLQRIANHQSTNLAVDLADVAAYDQPLARCIGQNTHHYIELFSQVVDDLLPSIAPTVAASAADIDVVEMIMQQREARLRAKNLLPPISGETGAEASPASKELTIPRQLLRRYSVTFLPLDKQSEVPVRAVKSHMVGSLINVRCIVTKVGEVRPQLQVATFLCDQCGMEVYQEVTSSAFMPVISCPSEACMRKDGKGRLFLLTRGSRFCKYQEVKVQELSDQVPMGHIPRAMTVHLTGDLVRQLSPGDHVVLSCIYLPRPYTGFKAIRAGLLTDTYLLCQGIRHVKQRYRDGLAFAGMAEEVRDGIDALARDPKAYDLLAHSIAPEIFGLDDIKKALLLLMVGGVSISNNQTSADASQEQSAQVDFKIRGDINVCLMGDPGVAKSQLLRAICKLAPRAVYTTGKGSSGVGLTAAVTKDTVTGELQLEGGALVLADNGICCIDEFDKMEEGDRTAIHEVMEQQTISISKAGITTTLNARTSVLAAANPLHGRYNPKRTPRENINLPPALLSRFDLLFLMLDHADFEIDTKLAAHITRLHSMAPEESTNADAIAPEVIRAYVAMAKRFQPTLPESLVPSVVNAYVSMRQHDLSARDATYTTARTLLAVLRLASACARVRLSNAISQADLDEALRLMQTARHSIDTHLPASNGSRSKRSTSQAANDAVDVSAAIYALIRDLARGQRSLSLDLIRERARNHKYSDDQLQTCLRDFDAYNVWRVSDDGSELQFVD